MRAQRTAVGLLIGIGTVVACSNYSSPTGTGGGSVGGTSATIVASSMTTGGPYGNGGTYFFSPSPDTVSTGTTVQFTFGAVAHDVHFDAAPNAPDSIASTENASVGRKFTGVGTYTYRCTLHGESGVVVVR